MQNKVGEIAYPNLMYFFRWITKSEHGLSNIADKVKARTRRIANSPTNESASQAITDPQERDPYNDKAYRLSITFCYFLMNFRVNFTG